MCKHTHTSVTCTHIAHTQVQLVLGKKQNLFLTCRKTHELVQYRPREKEKASLGDLEQRTAIMLTGSELPRD